MSKRGLHESGKLAAALLALLFVDATRADRLLAATTDDVVVQSETSGSAYRNMMSVLSLMPGENWQTFPFVSYVDFRAAERAAGIDTPNSSADLAAMDRASFDRWVGAMSRIKVAPFDLAGELGRAQLARAVPGVISVFQGLPSAVGIDWFDVDRAAAMAGPVIVLHGDALSADTAEFRAAMKTNQFELRDENGGQLWTRFAAGESRSDAAFQADASGSHFLDFFGVTDGRGAGIAPLPHALLGTPDWNSVRSAMLGPDQGTLLKAKTPFGPAVEALNAPLSDERLLVQAALFGIHYEGADAARVMLGQFATDEQVESLRRALAERPALPRYDLIALADIQDGPDEVALVALLYPDQEAAARAARVLADRFEHYRPLGLPTSLIATVDGRVTALVFESSDGKYSGAVAVLRTTPKAEPDLSIWRPGRMFRLLLEGIAMGDVDPFVCE